MNKNSNPLVSIIIPIYNGSNYMREAIDSALAQTYENIEIIVVNDGSTDNTEEIAKSYGDKIRYFSKENGGVATALNLALKEMKGEYFSWLSHDDVYYSDKIEKQIIKLRELEKEARGNTILYSNYSLINEKSELISKQLSQEEHDLKKINHPLYPLFNGLIHGCTLLIPKKCFDKIGYFNPDLKATQDYDLWFKMFPEYNLMFMNDISVKSRVHDEQNSKKMDSRKQELDDLWMNMITGITEEQKVELSGDVLNFYKNTYDYVKYSGRSLVAEKYLYNKIKEVLNSDNIERPMIIANIASYPVRKNSLKMAIKSILPQVDVLNVYLNDYNSIPDFLDDPRINCVLSKNALGNLKDNGKFYFLDKTPEDSYYFTIDDDIIYPCDYIKRMVSKLNIYNNEVVVGVHGIIFHSNFSNFTKSRTTLHFKDELKKELNVSALGTGTVAFYLPTLKQLNIESFKESGMSDLWFAVFCKKRSIPLVCIKRKNGWLKDVMESEETLWQKAVDSSVVQDKIIIENKLWELPADSLLVYRDVLEEDLRNIKVINSGKQNRPSSNIRKSQIIDLLHRTMNRPYKIFTFPVNLIRILLGKNRK